MEIDPRRIEVIDDEQAAVLRRKGRMHSVQVVASGWDMTRSILLAQIRRRHPDWSTGELEREVSRRMMNGTT